MSPENNCRCRCDFVSAMFWRTVLCDIGSSQQPVATMCNRKKVLRKSAPSSQPEKHYFALEVNLYLGLRCQQKHSKFAGGHFDIKS